jgi:hypothetical protein
VLLKQTKLIGFFKVILMMKEKKKGLVTEYSSALNNEEKNTSHTCWKSFSSAPTVYFGDSNRN